MPSLMPQMPAICVESCAMVPSSTMPSSITSSKKPWTHLCILTVQPLIVGHLCRGVPCSKGTPATAVKPQKTGYHPTTKDSQSQQARFTEGHDHWGGMPEH